MLTKNILQYINETYASYNIVLAPNDIKNLPSYLLAQPNFLLNIGNYLPIPTHIQFFEDYFIIETSFNTERVVHHLIIPYKSLLAIFEIDMSEGFVFTQKQTSTNENKNDEKIKQTNDKKPNLKAVN